MPVEDADFRRAVAELREERVDRAEGVVLIGHEDAPDRVHDERTFLDDPTFAWIPRREVQRPDAVLERVDLFEKAPLVPDVVSVRDDVRASVVDLARDLAGQARATGGVLAVDDDEVDAAFALQGGNERANRLTTRLSDDVAHEQDSHRPRAMNVSNGVAVARVRSVARGHH